MLASSSFVCHKNQSKLMIWWVWMLTCLCDWQYGNGYFSTMHLMTIVKLHWLNKLSYFASCFVVFCEVVGLSWCAPRKFFCMCVCVMVAQITFKVVECEIARQCSILKKKTYLRTINSTFGNNTSMRVWWIFAIGDALRSSNTSTTWSANGVANSPCPLEFVHLVLFFGHVGR